MPLPFHHPDLPNFRFHYCLCMHCAEHQVCEDVAGNAVCERCFYEYYNRDWSPREDKFNAQIQDRSS